MPLRASPSAQTLRAVAMAALGQKQTLRHFQLMSALPPIADMDQSGFDVRFVPKADIETSLTVTLFARRAHGVAKSN
jgi:hypothetical protein